MFLSCEKDLFKTDGRGKILLSLGPKCGWERWINARLPRPSHPVAEGCWNPNMVQRIWKNRHKSAMAISPSCWGICKRHLWLPNSSSLLPQFLPKMAPWWAPCLMALGIILLIALYASMFAFLAYKYLTRGRWDPYWQGCLKMWVRSVVWKLLHWFVIIAISTGHCCHHIFPKDIASYKHDRGFLGTSTAFLVCCVSCASCPELHSYCCCKIEGLNKVAKLCRCWCRQGKKFPWTNPDVKMKTLDSPGRFAKPLLQTEVGLVGSTLSSLWKEVRPWSNSCWSCWKYAVFSTHPTLI